jgi:hypothetical protein
MKGDWSEEKTKKYLSDRMWKKFGFWMMGQTRPLLKNKKPGYFSWDAERFADLILEGKSTYFD